MLILKAFASIQAELNTNRKHLQLVLREIFYFFFLIKFDLFDTRIKLLIIIKIHLTIPSHPIPDVIRNFCSPKLNSSLNTSAAAARPKGSSPCETVLPVDPFSAAAAKFSTLYCTPPNLHLSGRFLRWRRENYTISFDRTSTGDDTG